MLIPLSLATRDAFTALTGELKNGFTAPWITVLVNISRLSISANSPLYMISISLNLQGWFVA